MSDNKIIITPDQAESLLYDGVDYIHNFVDGGSLMIGGDECKRVKHPIAVWESKKRVSFFQANMDKVDAFEMNLEKNNAQRYKIQIRS